MNESDHRSSGGALPHLDDDAIAHLIESAGPRPPIPTEDLDAIAASARTAWRARMGTAAAPAAARAMRPAATAPRREPRQRSPVIGALAIAAAIAALLIGLRLWSTARDRGVLDTGEPGVATNLATVEAVSGSPRVEIAGVERPLGPGEAVASGSVVRTGAHAEEADRVPSRVAMRLRNGTMVRFDTATEARLVSPTRLDLIAGAIYVDTDAIAAATITGAAHASDSPAAIEIHTPWGIARDLGTRFQIRLGEGAGVPVLAVVVRSGAVSVERDELEASARDGEQLRINAAGAIEVGPATSYGSDWVWIIDAAPPFDVSGRSIADVLEWVARETGWTVRYESAGLAEATRSMMLEASRARASLRADQAPFVLLPGADLEGDLEDGVLEVRRRRHGP